MLFVFLYEEQKTASCPVCGQPTPLEQDEDGVWFSEHDARAEQVS